MIHPGWLLVAGASLRIVGSLGIAAWEVAIAESVRADDLVSPALIAGRYQTWALAGELLLVVETLALLAAAVMFVSTKSWAALVASGALLLVLLAAGAGHLVEPVAAWAPLGLLVALAFLLGITSCAFGAAWWAEARGLAVATGLVGALAALGHVGGWTVLSAWAGYGVAALAVAVGIFAARTQHDA